MIKQDPCIGSKNENEVMLCGVGNWTEFRISGGGRPGVLRKWLQFGIAT